MKFLTLLIAAAFFACEPQPENPAAAQKLTGERGGDFLILDAPAFYDQPQQWHIDDSAADLFFNFDPSKKVLEIKSARFQFSEFADCQVWLGPFSEKMATAETSLAPQFPIFPPPAPFLADCEKAGRQFLAAPTEATADHLVFKLPDDFWEAWETGCLDWPWSVHFQFFAKSE